MRLSQQWNEFKKFALKGNFIDLAAAVVLGGAFGKVVDGFVKSVIMPLLSYVTPSSGRFQGWRSWHIGRVEIGTFLGELLNFMIIALAMYLIFRKAVGAIEKIGPHGDEPEEPATKECPFCLSSIPYKARKCAHCTVDLTPVGVNSDEHAYR